jgi:hypothetical protein
VFLPPDSTTLAREPFRDFAAESTRDGKTPRTSKLAELFRAPEDIMAKGNFEQVWQLELIEGRKGQEEGVASLGAIIMCH